MDVNADLLQWVIMGGAVTRANKSVIQNEIIPNQELAEELHKQIIRKFEKQKVHLSFKDNIWCDYLAGMHLISK